MLLVKINFILKKKKGPTSSPPQSCLESIAKFNCKQLFFFKVYLFLDCISDIFQYLLQQTVKHVNIRLWKKTVQGVFTERAHHCTDTLVFQMLSLCDIHI